ncbi:MAG: head GIN domain-containing protein [Melioribacteraceae bacterium]
MIKNILFVILVIMTFISCKIGGIKGNGDEISENREVDSFQMIDVSGNFDVLVEGGQSQDLAIYAESNLIEFIKTKVKNNILYIYSKENLRPTQKLLIQISVPKLLAINCSGANNVHAKDINSDKFEIDLSGAGTVEIDGMTNFLSVELSGAADLMAKDFITENIKIDVSGAANAEVYASESIDADISGAGNIELYGDAKNVNTDISGAGSLDRK